MNATDIVSGLVVAIVGVVSAILLAITEAATVPIAVAAITGVSAIASARYAAAVRSEIKSRVGSPNGNGNVVEMLEKILNGQTGQDSRLAAHDDRLARLEGNVQAIRQDCHLIRAADEATAERVQDIARGVGVDRRHTDEEHPWNP